MQWRVAFYVEDNGSVPVQEFLDSLSLPQRAKALAAIRLLESAGPVLPFPYSSQVRGKIRELRAQFGRDKIRVLYFADEDRIFILLAGLLKRTAALPESIIALAIERMNRHLVRKEKRK